MNRRLPSLTFDHVSLGELRTDPANPRRISEPELHALECSLRQFGSAQPVLARREGRTVIGGHKRLVAARRLGLTTVPVIWLDLSTEQGRLLGLALNKISGSGTRPMSRRTDTSDDGTGFNARVAELASDLVVPVRVPALEKLGDGRRAETLAVRWLPPKLDRGASSGPHEPRPSRGTDTLRKNEWTAARVGRRLRSTQPGTD